MSLKDKADPWWSAPPGIWRALLFNFACIKTKGISDLLLYL